MRKLIFYTLLILILNSCYEKDFFEKATISKQYQPIYALPIGKLEFNLYDFIFKLDTAIKQYDDSLIYVLFQQKILTLEAADVIEIPDLDMPSLNNLSIPGQQFPPVDSIVLLEQELSYSFGTHNDDDQYIDSIILNSANLIIDLNTSELSPAKITLTYNNIKRNNVDLLVPINLSTGQDSYNGNIVLGNTDVIDFTDSPNNNIFKVKANITIYRGSRTSLNNATLSLSTTLNNIDYSKIFGYFGRFQKPQSPQNVQMDVFQFLPENAEFFREPSLKLFIANSFGLPMSFIFDQFQFSSSKNFQTLDISGSGVPTTTNNAKDISYPSIIKTGETVFDSIFFDNTNSNISEAFHFGADQLTIQPSIYLNKNGYTNQNFATKNSKMDISYKIEMPLAAKISEFNYGDTIPFKFNDLSEDIEQIEKITLKLIVKNGFPTDAKLQVDFLNEFYGVVRNLTKADLITSGTVENNKVVEPSIYKPEIIVDKDVIQNSQNTAFLSFVATVQTAQGGNVFVDFYSYYKIEIQVGVKAELNIDLSKNE